MQRIDKKISIIMPAFNEADTIESLLNAMTPYIQNSSFEVCIINDGSTDNTSEIVNRFSQVRLINHPYNKGYGAALKTGIRNATGDYILMMDSDGQHSIEDIPKLLNHIDDYDMVVGERQFSVGKEWIRKPGKLLLSYVANYLSGIKIPDINSGFRLIRKKCVLEYMHILPNGFSFSTTITLAMLKDAYNVKYEPINIKPRAGGKSYVSQTRDGAITLLLITRCISLFNPLKVYVPAAIIILIPSFIFAIFGVVKYFSFPKSSIVGILSGIILIFLGILSDQIAAIRRENH